MLTYMVFFFQFFDIARGDKHPKIDLMLTDNYIFRKYLSTSGKVETNYLKTK